MGWADFQIAINSRTYRREYGERKAFKKSSRGIKEEGDDIDPNEEESMTSGKGSKLTSEEEEDENR